MNENSNSSAFLQALIIVFFKKAILIVKRSCLQEIFAQDSASSTHSKFKI